MLEQNDLQAIGTLLDEKLKENNKLLKDEIITEMGAASNEAFSGIERRLEKIEVKVDKLEVKVDKLEVKVDKLEVKVDKLGKDMADRPTKAEIFGWADRRIVDLELAKDRHDFMHVNELDKLPAPAEISRVLVERGFKQKIV